MRAGSRRFRIDFGHFIFVAQVLDVYVPVGSFIAFKPFEPAVPPRSFEIAALAALGESSSDLFLALE